MDNKSNLVTRGNLWAKRKPRLRKCTTKCLQRVQMKVFWTFNFVFFHRAYLVNFVKVNRYVDLMPDGINMYDI